ncbi:TIGR02206 family membrane protein [Rossellomorea aquimaris]|uniref:TIGR02206 family membrane protein n=1 Tax=Rossellomorea aquimaris TaxID=189382 RepID=A0A5D4TV87_9BACI|nr:TIGR02206 family membrane protein [Rossellomorea aquimaris]TYS78174.1 TIGR02206 family membrane protein [Rossellomorea aquimaris]
MLKEILNFDSEGYPFVMFSMSHLMAIGTSIMLMVLFYLARDRIIAHGRQLIRYLLIALLIFGEVSFQYWYFINDRWDTAINLPFQLCSLSLYLCTFMLLTRSYRIFEISFFVSMTGAFVAILTPELFYGFPHFRYFQFFIAHIAIILSCLYMVWIEGCRATYSSVLKSLAALNIIAFFVFLINIAIDANYMFLLHKPVNASPIDLLGPYPWYILSLEAVAFILFSLLYLPFHLSKKKEMVKEF